MATEGEFSLQSSIVITACCCGGVAAGRFAMPCSAARPVPPAGTCATMFSATTATVLKALIKRILFAVVEHVHALGDRNVLGKS